MNARIFLVGTLAVTPLLHPARVGGQSLHTPDSVVEVVIESESGEPVSGATVYLLGPLPEDETSDSIPLVDRGAGRYLGEVPRTGLFRLRVLALGYVADERDVRLSASGARQQRLTIRLERDPLGVPEIVARTDGRAARLTGHSSQELTFLDPASNTADLGSELSRLAGVVVRRYGPGGQQLISVRGSRPEGVLVLLDGMPLNDPFFGAADLSAVALATLESASVIRGATSQLGPGGLGGVVALRSRQPDGNTVVASGAIGSFGMRNVRVHASASGGPGALAVTGEASTAENDFRFVNRDHPAYRTEVRRNADARGFRVSAVARAAGFPLTVQARFDRSERGVPGRMGTALFDQARWRDGGLQLTGQLGTVSGPQLTAGLALREQRYTDPRTGTDDPLDVGSGRLGGVLPFGETGAWQIRGQIAHEGAHGAKAAGSPARTLFGTSVARRIRTASVDLDAAMTVDIAAGSPVWSPELGVEFRTGRGISLAGRVGQSLRWPTLADLYYSPSFGVRANPWLKPERVVLDAELSAVWNAPRSLGSVRATVYQRHTRDPIIWHASDTAIWRPENLESLTARGLEVGLDWRPQMHWRLGVSGTYDRSRVGFGDNHNPLPYQPAWTGRFLVTRRFGSSYLEADLGLLGSRTTSLAATHSLPAFALLDVAAGRSFRVLEMGLRIDMRIRNILDQRHELVELYPEPGRHFELRVGFATGRGSEPVGRAGRSVAAQGSASATSG